MNETMKPEEKATMQAFIEDLSKVCAPHTEYLINEDLDEEEGVLAFNGSIKPFFLPPTVTKELGLDDLVRCRVIGNVEEGMGIAFILRSLNPFNRNVRGMFVQPRNDQDEIPFNQRGIEVFYGTAHWPKRSGAYWGTELFDRETVEVAPQDMSNALFETVRIHANRKK